MTPKQALFVAEYLKDFNGKRAAIRAGYAAPNAEVTASRLLRQAKVKAAIAKAQDARVQRIGIDADRVLEEVKRLALSDVRCLFDEHGKLRPLHTLTDEQAAAIASVEVVIKNAQAGDGHTDTVHKVKVWDKPKSLEMLMRHLGLFNEQASLSGTIQLVWGESQGS